MSMIPCPSCSRHHLASEESCPFCASEAPKRTPIARKAFHLVGGAVTTVVLAACYGVGGFEDDPVTADMDNDGYDEFEDCNDNDPDIYPGAEEVCDDSVDNDCDNDVDDADSDCASE